MLQRLLIAAGILGVLSSCVGLVAQAAAPSNLNAWWSATATAVAILAVPAAAWVLRAQVRSSSSTTILKARDIEPGDVMIVRHPTNTPGDVHISRFPVVGVEVIIHCYDGRSKTYRPDVDLEVESNGEGENDGK